MQTRVRTKIEIGKRIQELRESRQVNGKKMTQEELAEMSGFTLRKIQRMEEEGKELTIPNIDRIEQALELKRGTLIFVGDDETNEELMELIVKSIRENCANNEKDVRKIIEEYENKIRKNNEEARKKITKLEDENKELRLLVNKELHQIRALISIGIMTVLLLLLPFLLIDLKHVLIGSSESDIILMLLLFASVFAVIIIMFSYYIAEKIEVRRFRQKDDCKDHS